MVVGTFSPMDWLRNFWLGPAGGDAHLHPRADARARARSPSWQGWDHSGPGVVCEGDSRQRAGGAGAGTFPAVLADQKQKMFDQYAADRPGLPPGRVVNAMLTDQIFRMPVLRMAQAQARWRPTYVYQFDWHVPYVNGLPQAQNLGAMHTEELPFVLGNLDLNDYPRGAATLAAEKPQLTKLSQDMMDAWSGFARTGCPGWRSYTTGMRATKIWDVPERVQDAPRDVERAMWDGYSFSDWDLEPWPPTRA